MPSQAQIDAARRNGAKSQGPKTPQGKATSSANSLRHGMTAKAILLTSENPEAYTKLAEAYYVKFQPADDVECDLVDEMLIAKWRLRRDWSNEAALFDLEMDHQTKKVDSEYTKIDHACRYALAFRALADESKSIQLLTRYEAAHHRAYYKALDTLLKLRAQLKPGPDPDQSPAQPEQEPSNAPECTEPVENNLCETNPSSGEPTPAKGQNPGAETRTNGENIPASHENSKAASGPREGGGENSPNHRPGSER